jgi:DNA helicase-2/ATP-dependent DNA helicase PcrA
VSDIDLWEDRANAVSLMTLHNAKGLEFTVVLIPGLEEGLLPHASSLEDDDEMEEERRLFYVGMTRAKDELHLLAADTRRRAGVLDFALPSRFIGEIEREHLEVASAAGPVRVQRRAGARGRPERRRVEEPRGRPSYEDYSQDEPDAGPGTRVRHPTLGDGVIVEVSGRGFDAIVLVRFDDGSERRILTRFGKLEVLPE